MNRDGSTYQVVLTLSADHSFVRDWRMYQATSVSSMGVLVAYSTSEGKYAIRNDSIFMGTVVNRDWARDFYGGKVIVTPVTTTGQYADHGARYEVSSETLVLHFLTYPADAPIETMASYSRIR